MAKNTKKVVKIDWGIIQSRMAIVLKFLKWPMIVLLAALIISPRFWDFWTHLNVNPDAARVVLDYISVLRWPLVVLVALVMLRPYLPKLVDRLRKASAGKASAEFAPPDQQIGAKEIESLNKDEENKQPAELATQEDVDEQAALHQILTTAEVKLAFKQIYNEIFGSQLAVVKRLKDYVAEGLTKDQLIDLYDSHVENANSPYPSFESFMQYAIDSILVLYDAKDKHYKLTNAGVYFLQYLVEKGDYQRYKPY
ncbi:hypothetical protein [Mycobacteroides abscessus]|uniref:hypothetical protein n=1 Tax=Mycobacteroides abscessus TaxID=36809 RepID=UPI00104227A7|nr:hypothetical protein [Mycobacteroides abscessus]